MSSPCTYLMVLLVFVLQHIVATSYCPTRCTCDDEKLHVTCGEGNLDVLPIALNPSIERLVIQYNRIKTIDSSVSFYTELTVLDMSSNHLLNIPDKTFIYQKKLLELHLSNNKISAVTNQTFFGLIELQVLNLRKNLIDELSSNLFFTLPNLQELNLASNRIGRIDAKTFQGLSNLKVLYLDDNNLATIPSESFKPMVRLAELYLGANSFLNVPNGAFQDLKQLSRLDLHGVLLVNLSTDSLLGLERVKSLDLSDNHFLKIPTVQLSRLKRLEELTIGQNDFEVITEGAFFGLNNLKRIAITGSLNLKRIQSGAFASNTNLESIVISSNKQLNEIQEGAFSGLPHLKNVILKDNSMATFREELLPWKDLVAFDISENPIRCDCNMMWFKSLLTSRRRNESLNTVICVYPERFHGESLDNLSPDLIGCAHISSRERAIFGMLLVGTAAIVTAVALISYKYRYHIIEYIRCIWHRSNNLKYPGVGEKEQQYHKTFSEEEFFSRGHHHHPHQNIYEYIHKVHPAPQTPNISHYAEFSPSHNYFKPIPISEL